MLLLPYIRIATCRYSVWLSCHIQVSSHLLVLLIAMSLTNSNLESESHSSGEEVDFIPETQVQSAKMCYENEADTPDLLCSSNTIHNASPGNLCTAF
ncbi:uncharacterized protein AKAME5_000581700 [Lates japonicus]|uniref:Uncharacterized protein n=1 Tax=Lates japonicus TaxID=270547 RepID=A0AAD3MFI0_LATJO|nr:uncharacterized protein AKAME5_000581700 [Lates japonicus]